MACIPGHGGFSPYGDRLIVATGHPALIEIGPDHAVGRELETGLEGNHLMEFVVDDEADGLFAVGSCGYTGGFAEVDLRRQAPAAAEPRVFVSPQARGPVAADVPCGERVVLGPNGVVVARTATSIARADTRGALLTVDVATGEIVGHVETPAEPLDLIVLPPSIVPDSTNQHSVTKNPAGAVSVHLRAVRQWTRGIRVCEAKHDTGA